MIPGHPRVNATAVLVRYAASENDADVFADAGSPTAPVNLVVQIASGVVLGSTGPTNPSLDFSSFATGSSLYLQNAGKVQGAGGAGGQGFTTVSSSVESVWGGGGGGAGTVGGVGFPMLGVAAGADGTDTAGGAGGEFWQRIGGGGLSPTVGGDGGDAIDAGTHAITIDNASGEIFGGGGGGGGATVEAPFDTGTPGNNANTFGGTGGGPGDVGGDSVQVLGTPIAGGAAGYAVRSSGTVTFVAGGSSPNVEGTVS